MTGSVQSLEVPHVGRLTGDTKQRRIEAMSILSDGKRWSTQDVATVMKEKLPAVYRVLDGLAKDDAILKHSVHHRLTEWWNPDAVKAPDLPLKAKTGEVVLDGAILPNASNWDTLVRDTKPTNGAGHTGPGDATLPPGVAGGIPMDTLQNALQAMTGLLNVIARRFGVTHMHADLSPSRDEEGKSDVVWAARTEHEMKLRG